MKVTSSVFFGLVCLFILPICVVSQSPTPTAIPETAKNEADLIHFGDVIDVDFVGTLEYDWRGTLKSDGLLDGLDEFLSIIGLCRAETDVAADLARVYSKILRDPKVTVKIVDRSNRAVARLDGAVKMPTRFRILRPILLKEMIVTAGGFTDDVSGEIVILRPSGLNCVEMATGSNDHQPGVKGASGNGLITTNILISDLLSGKESADPLILSGDIITVGKAVPIYVIGAVNNPRPIYSHSGMTLTRAIATAGGLTKGAVEQKISIYRREGTNSTIIQIDLSKIKNGELNDVDLKPFDIIEVTFKGRAPRKYSPVIATGDNKVGNISDLPLRIID